MWFVKVGWVCLSAPGLKGGLALLGAALGQERINGVFAAADEDKHNGRHAQYKDVLKTGPGFRVDDEGGGADC